MRGGAEIFLAKFLEHPGGFPGYQLFALLEDHLARGGVGSSGGSGRRIVCQGAFHQGGGQGHHPRGDIDLLGLIEAVVVAQFGGGLIKGGHLVVQRVQLRQGFLLLALVFGLLAGWQSGQQAGGDEQVHGGDFGSGEGLFLGGLFGDQLEEV